MSKLFRAALEKNLDVVAKQLASVNTKPKEEYEAEIAELQQSLPMIKSNAVKAAVHRDIERINQAMNAPMRKVFWAHHVAELKSLKDGYEKILAVMANIPWYQQGLRPPVKKPAAKQPAPKTMKRR